MELFTEECLNTKKKEKPDSSWDSPDASYVDDDAEPTSSGLPQTTTLSVGRDVDRLAEVSRTHDSSSDQADTSAMVTRSRRVNSVRRKSAPSKRPRHDDEDEARRDQKLRRRPQGAMVQGKYRGIIMFFQCHQLTSL